MYDLFKKGEIKRVNQGRNFGCSLDKGKENRRVKT